jgi:very-short-patch-repair endonuclease
MPASLFKYGEQSKGDDCMSYKDKEWLTYEYVNQRRTRDEIAEQFGVSRRTVSHFIQKYNIPKPCQESEITVDVACHRCKNKTSKKLRYLKQRIRKGETKFYCDDCLPKVQSDKFSGENNPNYGGTFHGTLTSEWSPEKRKAASKKLSETRIANGTSKGANNPRWKGGRKELNCVICGKPSLHSPYTYRKITAGHQKPCCSNECSLALSRRSVKTSSTSIEIKMANELNARGIEYTEQYVLGDKFRLDFFLPEYNIVIECDGNYWHTLPATIARDKRKNAYVKACGFSMYRFWESEINRDVESCVDVVMAEINAKEAI